MDSTATLIIGGLATMWFLQLGLSYWQMRRFYRRVAELRRRGTVAIGMHGSMWRGRQYGVLVVDEQERIVHAEQLSGWTVLANLKPVAGVAGRTLTELFDDEAKWPIKPKLRFALRNAAQHIRTARERAAAKRAEAEAAAGESVADQAPA